jgi:hypothetical protein
MNGFWFLTRIKFGHLTRNLSFSKLIISLNWYVSGNELRNFHLIQETQAGNVDLGFYLRVNYNIITFATVACPTVRNWSAPYV